MTERKLEEMLERMRVKEQELDKKLAAVGETMAALEKEANAGVNSALLTQIYESSRLNSLKDTKPYVLLHEEAVKNIKKCTKELEDPAAVFATEREFQANVARWTQESQIDSSALSFYLRRKGFVEQGDGDACDHHSDPSQGWQRPLGGQLLFFFFFVEKINCCFN